jgi:hypothetical protein
MLNNCGPNNELVNFNYKNYYNIEPLKASLEAAGVPHTTLGIPGRRAVFCRDPDSNALEFRMEATAIREG